MATYNVKGPDGTMYTVEGPDDATDEELINSVLRRLETEKRIDVPDNPIPDPNKAMMQDEDAFVKTQEIDKLKQEDITYDALKQNDLILVVGATGGTRTADLIVVSSATAAATVTTINGT